MNIKKFSEMTGLTPRAIRFYEKKGLLSLNRDSKNGYRVFTREQVEAAKKIDQFRKLGFSIAEIENMLKLSPELSVTQVKTSIRKNLERLTKEHSEMEKRIRETQALLNLADAGEALSAKQKENFKYLAYSQLSHWSTSYIQKCLAKDKMGSAEELQMVACAYSQLILQAANWSAGDGLQNLAQGHDLIAKCLARIGEKRLSDRHRKMAAAYKKMT